MASPYPIAALLGALVYAARHDPAAAQAGELLALFRNALGARPVDLQARMGVLRVDDQPISADAPGAGLVSEQMLLHEIRTLTFPTDYTDQELLQLASVLAAFPGAYDSYGAVLSALGSAAARFGLARLSTEFEVLVDRRSQARPLIESPESASGELGRFQGTELNSEAAGGVDRSEAPTGGVVPAQRRTMEQLLKDARIAMDRQDWVALLDLAVQIVEGEQDTLFGLAASLHKAEFNRLMSRRVLTMIAQLAQGDRQQEAITVLRRFGADSAEVLMALLVDAGSISERRSYYSAMVQLREGTGVIVQHLTHPQWFVVRNAADLSGELALVEAIPALSRQSRHPDDRVRKAVAEALGKIAVPDAMDVLSRMLSDTAQPVRLQAVAHLSGRRVQAIVPAIGELLQREEDPAVQQAALLSLGRIGSPEAVALLGEWARAGGPGSKRKGTGARLSAIRGLALVGPGAIDALGSLERDTIPEIRTAAAAAIAGLRR